MTDKYYRVMCRLVDGRLCSYNRFLPPDVIVYHQEGKWTKAKVGRLFIWNDLNSAKIFAQGMDNAGVCEVWEVEAKSVKRLQGALIMSSSQINDTGRRGVEGYWNNELMGLAIITQIPAYSAIRTASAVKLIKKIAFGTMKW